MYTQLCSKLRRRHFFFSLAFLILLCTGVGVNAANEVISSFDVKTNQSTPEIFIDFNYPVHYVSHAPENGGDSLQVLLRPGSEAKWETNPRLWNQVKAWDWRATSELPLKKIIYEGMQQGKLKIVIQFARSVNYEIRSLPNNKTVVVSLSDSRQPVSRGNIGRGYIYAINLKSSVRPIDESIASSLPQLRHQEIYVAKHIAEEKTWYRLRAGFFEDHEVAKQKLQEVRDIFPRAWVAVATEDDQFISSKQSRAPVEKGIKTLQVNRKIDPFNEYAINLSSVKTEINEKNLPALQQFDDYLVYSSRATIDGTTWHRLRIGFFQTQAEAELLRQQLVGFYPSAATIKVARKERYVAAGIPDPGPADLNIAGEINIRKTPASDIPEVDALKAQTTTETQIAEVEQKDSTTDKTDSTESTAAGMAIVTPVTPVLPVTPDTPVEDAGSASEVFMITRGEPLPGDEKIAALMEEARQAMAKGDYSRAIALYNKVLQMPPNPYQQDALEFMGLARERKGQLAFAKSEYEKFLELYPEGDAAVRVRQRLAGLLTARDKPKEELSKTARNKSRSDWDFFGGISQYYRRDVNNTDEQGDVITQSSLISNLDFTARRRTDKYSFGSRISAGYLEDFTEDGDNETRVSSLYFDLADSGKKYFFRGGRQSRSTGGVLGRFDGGLFSYQFNKKFKANIVAGFPVDSSKDALESSRKLYGASLDISSLAKGWDFTTYAIEQSNSNLTDRRAVGAEARYFDPRKSLFSLVDYDVFYGSVNNALVLGSLTLENKTTLSMTLDYRNSPILTTNNALQGQQVDDIENLQDLFSDDEIYDLAEDRTANSSTITLSASYPFNNQYQINTDISYSEFSETPASGGVEVVPGTESLFFSTQLIGSSLLKDGDISILGLRYSDTDTASTTSLSLNTRYPVSQNFRINPRLRFDLRQNKSDSSKQVTTAPSLRLDYRWKRRLRFEMDIGGEFSSRDLPETDDSKSYFLNLGYRYDF